MRPTLRLSPGVLGGHWNRRIFEEVKAWGANTVRVPTLIQDRSFTPTEQGRLWKAAMLGQPLPAGE